MRDRHDQGSLVVVVCDPDKMADHTIPRKAVLDESIRGMQPIVSFKECLHGWLDIAYCISGVNKADFAYLSDNPSSYTNPDH